MVKYYSIREIFGVQWLNHLDRQNDSNKRRKLGAGISVRQVNTFTREICQYVKTNKCAENESPSIYIEAGAKYSSSRSTCDQQLIPKKLLDAEEESDLDILLGHPVVAESMTNFPKRNILLMQDVILRVRIICQMIQVASNFYKSLILAHRITHN